MACTHEGPAEVFTLEFAATLLNRALNERL